MGIDKSEETSIAIDSIAQINIGTERIPWDIHIELLWEHSAYFNEHFKYRYMRTVSEAVHIRDFDPDLFTQFINLVYRGKIFEKGSSRVGRAYLPLGFG